MKKVVGILLIVAAIALGYLGVTKFTESRNSVEVVGIELSAANSEEKNTSYVYLGAAVLSLVGGFVLLKNKKEA